MNERAKEDVEAFIHILKEQHGIDILDIQRAVRFFATYDKRSDLIARTIIKTLVLMIMSGIGYVVYISVMHFSQVIKTL